MKTSKKITILFLMLGLATTSRSILPQKKMAAPIKYKHNFIKKFSSKWNNEIFPIIQELITKIDINNEEIIKMIISLNEKLREINQQNKNAPCVLLVFLN